MIPKDNDCVRSDINVLQMMLEVYEERGGGYSQMEALNTAIAIMEEHIRLKEKQAEAIHSLLKRKDGE